MNGPARTGGPVLTRTDLRLGVTAGLATGLVALTPLPFGVYMPMAVLAAAGGTVGGTIGLGRQRMAGSLLGACVLLVCHRGLVALPFPLAIAISLALVRLLGGWLGLKVGYKVAGFIVVMGWLVHDEQLASWLPLRLLWTFLGIGVASLSFRLFWPSRALVQARRQWRGLFDDLADDLLREARGLDPATAGAMVPPSGRFGRTRMRRQQLTALRAAAPQLVAEIGADPHRHPLLVTFRRFDRAASSLIGVVEGLCRDSAPGRSLRVAPELRQAEVALLRHAAARLRVWGDALERQPGSSHLPAPPPLAPAAELDAIEAWLDDETVGGLDLDALQRLARRLMLCRQAFRAVERTERSWRELAP